MESDRRLRMRNEQRELPTASFSLRSDQIAHLRQIANGKRISQSAIVRDALDHYFRDMVQQAVDRLTESRSVQR